MHRFLLGCPVDMEIDHVNGNGLDNRRRNLRLATRSQNSYNATRRTDNTSGFKGVAVKGRLWQSYISIAGKRKPLGAFDTKEAAARVYDAWAKEAYCEFARLNLPDG